MSTEFVDLPKIDLRHKIFFEFAEDLRANPMRWAKYPKRIAKASAYTIASGINWKRAYAPIALSTGEFEATARAGVLYVRFTGTGAS